MSTTTFFQPDAPPPGTHFHYVIAVSETDSGEVVDSSGFSTRESAEACFEAELERLSAGHTATFGRVGLTDRERDPKRLPETVSHRAKWLADKGWDTGCVIERRQV